MKPQFLSHLNPSQTDTRSNNRYALKQATLDKFNVTATYYSTYGDMSGAVWCIDLNPINASDFSEIGCYTVLLNTETGEVVQFHSAADGRG